MLARLPNLLTIARIVLTIVIMGLVFVPGVVAKAWCVGLFVLAALTDWFDGYAARRFRQVTPLGVLLDPIADKILVVGLLLVFVQLKLIRAWMVLIIVIREFLITGVRLYAANRHVIIPAAKEGKQKTVSQMLTILVTLVLLLVQEIVPPETRMAQASTVLRVITWCMWVTVGFTVASGASFFWRNRLLLRDAVTR